MSENIYDRLSSTEAIRMVSKTFKDEKNLLRNSIHKICGLSIENLMYRAMVKGVQGDLTIIMISLENWEDFFEKLKRVHEPAYNIDQIYKNDFSSYKKHISN